MNRGIYIQRALYSGLTILASLFCAQSAGAVSLNDSLSLRGVDPLAVDLEAISSDGPGYNALAPFAGLLSANSFQVNFFSGGPGGSTLELFLISEVAGFATTNKVGVLDGQGDYTPILTGPDTPGSSHSLFISPTDEFTLALRSREGLFSAIDADTPDGVSHIVAKKAEKDGLVNFVGNANLQGLSFQFNLLAGDVVLFIEDLLVEGNLFGGKNNGGKSDRDFNDMVVVARFTSVPEPATLLLLGSGLVAFRLRRSRR